MLSFYIKPWIDRLRDRMTDRQTPVKQYVPYLSMRGHKKAPSIDDLLLVHKECKFIPLAVKKLILYRTTKSKIRLNYSYCRQLKISSTGKKPMREIEKLLNASTCVNAFFFHFIFNNLLRSYQNLGR